MESKSNATAATGSSQPSRITIPPKAFHARAETWRLLMKDGYHLCWHPQFVDFSLNKATRVGTVGEIVRSKAFLSACACFVATRPNSFGQLRVSSEMLFAANRGPTQPLLEIFLRAELQRVVGWLNMAGCSASVLEEVYNAVRYQFIINGAKFEPGRLLDNPRFATFGYSAFQRAYIRGAWTHVKKGFVPLGPAQSVQKSSKTLAGNDQMAAELTVQAQPAAVYDVRACLIPALRFALSDGNAWDVFHGIVYANVSFEDLAVALDVSPGWISAVVTAPIVERLRAFFGDRHSAGGSGRTKITDLKDLLCDLLPEHEFKRHIPRPGTSEPLRKMARLAAGTGSTVRDGDRQP